MLVHMRHGSIDVIQATINNAYFDGLYRLITNGKIGDSLLLLEPRWKLFFLFTPGFGHGARAAAMDELRLYYCIASLTWQVC